MDNVRGKQIPVRQLLSGLASRAEFLRPPDEETKLVVILTDNIAPLACVLEDDTHRYLVGIFPTNMAFSVYSLADRVISDDIRANILSPPFTFIRKLTLCQLYVELFVNN